MVNARDLCRQQWHWGQFGFEDNAELESFFKPKFRISQCFFIIYRAFVAVYVLAWNIALHATWRENAAHSSFYYLSNWIYLLLAIYLIYAFIVTLSYAARPEKEEESSSHRTLDVPMVSRRRRHRKEKRPHAEAAAEENGGRENRSPERKTAHKSHKIRKHREHIRLRVRHSKNYETRSNKTDASDPLLPENEDEIHVEKRSRKVSRFLHNGSLLLLPQKALKSKRTRRGAQKECRRETDTKPTVTDGKPNPHSSTRDDNKEPIRAKKTSKQLPLVSKDDNTTQLKTVDETRIKKSVKPPMQSTLNDGNNQHLLKISKEPCRTRKANKPSCQAPVLPHTKPKATDRASTSTSGPSGSNLPHPKDDDNKPRMKPKRTPASASQTANKGTQTRPEDLQDSDAPKPTPPSVAIKVFWVFHSTACNLSVVISLMVYMVMYPYLGALSALIIKVDAITLNCHGINSVIVLIDLMLSSVPVRIFHCVYPAILGILYVIFSLVYWSLDKYFNVLYIGILDWNNPAIASGISVLLIFVIVPLIQLLLFGLSLIRDLIHDCCVKKPEVQEPADSLA